MKRVLPENIVIKELENQDHGNERIKKRQRII
jgi:hypothetical protein